MSRGAPASSPPWEGRSPTDAHRRAYADAEPHPFWLGAPDSDTATEPLAGHAECDLCIVGGGLSGLWAALEAIEADPGRDVMLVEAQRVGHAASGRNGGFFMSSLTHGVSNGYARFPDEMPALERLGIENFDASVEAIRRHEIDCDLELTGDLTVALEPHQLDWLREAAGLMSRAGHEVELLGEAEARAEVASPTYLGAAWQRSGAAILDPGKLCRGLERTVRRLGVRVHEQTPVLALERASQGVELRTPGGTVRAANALLATSAFRGLVPAVRRRVVPVYDYVLVSEPLTARQHASVGWERRQGVGDSANQFHYYRLTADNRILWGGYDAIYNFRSGLRPALEQREESFATLSHHFFATFPQLEGLRFTHRWGGAIDTCARFFAFYGTAQRGRVAYAVGHTGLGVGASRFGARVALDLLAGRETEATGLRAIRSRPLPFPPEPLRWAAIELTRNRLAAADRRQGRRGAWLRLLDRLGLGYDS